MGGKIFPTSEDAIAVFGKPAAIYGALVNDISPFLTKERYHFEDLSVFETKALDPFSGEAYSRRVYWSEMLARAHMASVASIFRTTRWADAAVREYSAGNLFGWASSCRSLIEAAGDSAMSLSAVPLTLAQQNRNIRAQISGKYSGPTTICQELEETLIHFTHARKVHKSEVVPPSHKARQSADYVKHLEAMEIHGSYKLYSFLCELVHPASTSIATLFSSEDRGWTFSPPNEQDALHELAKNNKKLLGDVLSAAYNPPIIILKVLHKFDMFSKIDKLRAYRFDHVPIWGRIETALRD